MPMSVTERDRLVKLEAELSRAVDDGKKQDEKIAELNKALYGSGPNDKDSVFAQLMSLQNDRAIRIWFVSICAGIGATVVAWLITSNLPHS